MIALYHLCSGLGLDRFPQEVQDLLADCGVEVMPVVRRAKHVGWSSVPADVGALNLSPQQEAQARDRASGAPGSMKARPAEAYQVALGPQLTAPTEPVLARPLPSPQVGRSA